jgi:hypothetical protein
MQSRWVIKKTTSEKKLYVNCAGTLEQYVPGMSWFCRVSLLSRYRGCTFHSRADRRRRRLMWAMAPSQSAALWEMKRLLRQECSLRYDRNNRFVGQKGIELERYVPVRRELDDTPLILA